MTYEFNFTTREEYLAYRSDWRARYKAITLEIRANKQAQRDSTSFAEISNLQSQLHYARRRANQLMLERTEATEFKNAQLAERQLATA